MRTTEERIRHLHRRARELGRQRDQRRLTGLGSASVFFAVLLTAMLTQMDGVFQSVPGEQYAGASLLDETAGGYVLAAVIAFFVGVLLTAAIFRYRQR